jgi:DNA adenine methylase
VSPRDHARTSRLSFRGATAELTASSPFAAAAAAVVLPEPGIPLRAPFPWFGSKRRIAPHIWPRLGDVPSLTIPFFGSGAELWARPRFTGTRYERVNDADGFLVNFFRAVQAAPEDVLRWATWPTAEIDLIARHRLLLDSGLPDKMRADPFSFDARLAGFWLWGISAYIGQHWCRSRPGDQSMPYLTGGRGIHAQWFRPELLRALAARLAKVTIACGGWKRLLTRSALGFNNGHPTGLLPAGVILDPPYPEGEIAYAGDAPAEGPIWFQVARWAVENGTDPSLRIAFCGYSGLWKPPRGWTEIAWKAQGGYGVQDGENANAARERVWFSPGCLKVGHGGRGRGGRATRRLEEAA